MVRFGIVGTAAVAIQYATYLLLIHWTLVGVNVANTVAYPASFLLHFVASTRFTFRVKATAGRGLAFAWPTTCCSCSR